MVREHRIKLRQENTLHAFIHISDEYLRYPYSSMVFISVKSIFSHDLITWFEVLSAIQFPFNVKEPKASFHFCQKENQKYCSTIFPFLKSRCDFCHIAMDLFYCRMLISKTKLMETLVILNYWKIKQNNLIKYEYSHCKMCVKYV